MKVLILSANNGAGHNTAAAAIKTQLQKKGIYADIEDSVAFISKGTSKFISKGHVLLYRKFPLLLDAAMKSEAKKSTNAKKDTALYDIFKTGSKKLLKFIELYGYDTVVCTHVFGAFMLTHIKREYGIPIKTAFVATDYSCSIGVAQTDMDIYFLPHERLKEEFLKNGVAEEKMCFSGIPVRESFYYKRDKNSAKEELFIPKELRVLLLMGGSMGAGPMLKIATDLSESVAQDVQIIVVCAGNASLRKELHKLKRRNIRIMGYTSKISLLMNACEIMISKPGGLSCTEAAASKTPAIYMDIVKGCETANMRFFSDMGYALYADTEEQLIKKVNQFLHDENAAKKIIRNIEESFPKHAAEDIAVKLTN